MAARKLCQEAPSGEHCRAVQGVAKHREIVKEWHRRVMRRMSLVSMILSNNHRLVKLGDAPCPGGAHALSRRPHFERIKAKEALILREGLVARHAGDVEEKVMAAQSKSCKKLKAHVGVIENILLGRRRRRHHSLRFCIYLKPSNIKAAHRRHVQRKCQWKNAAPNGNNHRVITLLLRRDRW